MFSFRSSPFEEDIEKATDEKNVSEDWAAIMHICDNAINYQDGAKYCFKAIMKRLHHSVPRVVLQTLTLLDACVKNCDKKLLLQVASNEFISEIRKLLPKMHPSTALKLKELIQKWSLEEFKDDPELCIIPSFYYKLVSEGVEFPTCEKKLNKTPVPLSTNPDAVNSQEEENDIIKAIEISLKDTGRYNDMPDLNNSLHSETFNKPSIEPFKVRVLYDFEAAEDNELTIKAGEIVLVVDNSNSSWWKGTNHRGEGLFPANFASENLDEITEKSVVETIIAPENDCDSGDQEVKLDEEKIELVLNWLNETDPTSDLSDPDEMLKLEKQCYKMAPLIEEHLQTIDNRLAMLNKMNEDIMKAFERFHNFSNMWPATDPTLKYATSNRGFSSFPQSMTNFPAPTPMGHPSLQFMPLQDLHQIARAADSVQAVNYTVTNTPDSPVPNSKMAQQAELVSKSPTHKQPDGAIPTSISTQNQPSEVGAPTSSVDGCYMPPQAFPYPLTYGPNMMQQGFMQGTGTMPKFMTLPYQLPTVGPYFPFPCYYVNNTVPSQSVAATTETVSNVKKTEVKQENVPKSFTTAESTESTPMMPMSNYSQDLQNLTYISSGDFIPNQAAMPDKSKQLEKESDECKDNL